MTVQPVTVLYEDNHLLVVVKPINLPVQSDRSGSADLLNLLRADLKKRYQKPGNVFVGLVHRLDRPVGGVMVFAKTSKAAARLSELIRTRNFKKTYYAVARGVLPSRCGCLSHYLKKEETTNTVKVVAPSEPGAKEAILNYQVLETREELSLIRVDLVTGRPHQIRVQLAAVGTPLCGDQKYGHHVNCPGQQIALWAGQIEFKHPTRPELMRFTCKPPQNDYPWSLFALFK
ncbi:MAG TPA: RluA family pseudouridine synthase [Bacillota bacterium]